MKKRILAAFGALIFACSLPLTEASAASTKQFSDVPHSKYFAEAVYDLAERNILGDYPDGTFKPGNSITWCGTELKRNRTNPAFTMIFRR